MTPLQTVTLNQNGLVTPIPMRYEVCGEAEQGINLKVGELYKLQGEKCDGFDMPIRVYTCKGVVEKFRNISLDAVIMKQVEGEEDTIFSLTRLDCKLLGIEYEPKLQLFPIDFDWLPMVRQEIRDFTVANLGTYKPSPINGTIQRMHIFIREIEPCGQEHLFTPNHTMLPIGHFLESLRISFRDENLNRRYPILAKPLLTGGEKSPFFDRANNGINFMLFFTPNDNVEGINPTVFEGKTFDEIFKVTWSEPILAKFINHNGEVDWEYA